MVIFHYLSPLDSDINYLVEPTLRLGFTIKTVIIKYDNKSEIGNLKIELN